MIIYGWNSKVIKQAPLNNLTCDNCNEQNSLLAIYSKYVHIFWIPVFPYGKEAVIVCSHCQKATKEKDLDTERKQKIKALKSSVKTPLYLFSGLILIVMAIGYFSYASGKTKQEELTFLEDPAVGDIYMNYDKTEQSEYKYYLWKVTNVSDDSIYVSPGSFSYNMIPSKLEKEDGFYDVYFGIHKDEIREMYETGELKEIERYYDPESTGFGRTISYSVIDSVNSTQ